jgi:hypothetical protein
MRVEDVEEAVEAANPPESGKCAFAAQAHAFLSSLARRSGWLQAIGLRAAAGGITMLRKKWGCP